MKAFYIYKTYLDDGERDKPNVYWYYDPTGCGKTKKAHDKFKDICIKN
jgi:hypothetical protein